MAFQLAGSPSNTVVEVDPIFKALRQTIRPEDSRCVYSLAGQTGDMTGVAAGGGIFSIRNIGTNLLIIKNLSIAVNVKTGFTTPQPLVYSVFRASNFTASDGGGTSIYFLGHNKHRISLPSWATAPDIRVAGTGSLSGGTRTLDTNPLAATTFFGVGAGQFAAYQAQPLLQHDPGDYPVVLGQNEGLSIANAVLMGAGGIVNAIIQLEYSENIIY